MHVCCVTSSYPTGPDDAAGRFVHEQCSLLHEAGFDVTVFTWRRRRGDRPFAEPWEVVELGPLPPELSVFGADGAPDAIERSPWRALEAPTALASLLNHARRRPAPDLWIGHWLVPGGLAARAAGKLTDTPSLVIGHSGGVHLLRRLPRPLRETLLGVITAGPTTLPSMALARAVEHEVEVLPMGFHPVAPAGPRSDAVLCFGRLVPIKGFDLVPEALVGLGRRVHVGGDGPERRALTQAFWKNGVAATFHGWVGRLEKPALFGRADAALFPSRVQNGRHEGWPVSVLEVSAAGAVPLVAGWPGADEMVVRPELQVVRDWSPRAWRAALERWSRTPEPEKEKLRTRTVEFARSFTWDALGPEWLRLVAEAAA